MISIGQALLAGVVFLAVWGLVEHYRALRALAAHVAGED